MNQLSLATYNLWHGLSPTSWIRFKSLEPKSRREQRQLEQAPLLKSIEADAIFLQEVNPVWRRARELGVLLQMREHWGRDNSGLKLARLGPPYNLDSGLATLLKKEHIKEWSKPLMLSGEDYSIMNQFGSLQWNESRYAFLVSTVSPNFGRILWVNVHLHHGLEYKKIVEESIEKLVSDGLISSDVGLEISERIREGDLRRVKEVNKLLAYLEEVKHRYSLILIGGDFNCSPESVAWSSFSDFGMIPLQTQTPGELLSWDSHSNKSNHMLSKDFEAPLFLDDLSFDQRTIDELKTTMRDLVMSPTQLDYLWGWSNTGEISVQSSKLFGQETTEGVAPSDHLGLVSRIEWTSHNV